MAIDKIIPRFFTSSTEQRLLGEGAMTEAHNVTFAENGDGTEMILKNVSGTIAATAATASDAPTSADEVVVVGSVSDDQRGFVYFFVADRVGSSQHAIYQYNTSDNTYRVVFKSSWLNFDPSSFVKADLINRNFQQDNNVQTVIYFTDNVNPPRKINVDRAISGDYNFDFDNERDHAISTIKAPISSPPRFRFETDESIRTNNFSKSVFQFATQVVYQDGEESAISPYSKVAFSDTLATAGLDDPDDVNTVFQLVDNVCVVDIRISDSQTNANRYRPDIKRVRVLCREGNLGAWLVADEFDPSENLTRNVFGSALEVYNADTKEYRFYNQNVYTAVDQVTVNKPYDNVPLLAEGQTIVGNRLMYSNYVEGRPNHPSASNHDINVIYQDETDGAIKITSDEADSIITEVNADNDGKFEIDLLDSTEYTALSDEVPDASTLTVSFNFQALWEIPSANDREFWGVAGDDNGRYVGVGFGVENGILGGSPANPKHVFSTTISFGSGSTVQTLVDALYNELSEMNTTEIDYNATELDSTALQGTVLHRSQEYIDHGYASPVSVGDELDFGGTIKVEWDFNVSVAGSVITVRPFPRRVILDSLNITNIPSGSGLTFGHGLSFSLSDQTLQNPDIRSYVEDEWEVDTSEDIVDNVPFESTGPAVVPDGWSVPNFYLSNRFTELLTKESFLSFKSGSTHEIGVVYFDKYGRHGFVNRIGQAYVKALPERSGSEGKGAAQIEVDWQTGNNMPTWATSWSIVYPGCGSFSDVTQYTVGHAFVAEGDNNAADQTRKRVYVSLNSLENYKDKKGARIDYSFTEGDKLRIVSHRNSDDTDFVYPNPSNDTDGIIEFNVVDYVDLGNEDNPLEEHGHTGSIPSGKQGRFLVLDAPDVNGGAVDADGDDITYPGFDWFSVANNNFGGAGINYPHSGGGVANGGNKWLQNCLVEIVTPRVSEPSVFYEIGVTGERVAVRPGDPNSPATNHGANPVFGGDIFFRSRSCDAPVYDNGWDQSDNDIDPNDYVFKNRSVESFSASDFVSSRSWSRGRAFTVFESAAEVRRYNGITYSDAYAEDVANLSLSSFNLSLANFSSLDSKYGACRYIANYDEDILGLQENKVSLAKVNKDILTTATSEGLVSLSTEVVGPFQYYKGDYGIGKETSSALVYDSDVFFADSSRRKFVRFNPGAGGVIPISDVDVASFFDDTFEAAINDNSSNIKVVTGYDPRVNVVYVTIHTDALKQGDSVTAGYSLKYGKWMGTYGFAPDAYANQNRLMYSALYRDSSGDDENLLFHRHEDDADPATNRTNFYGDGRDAMRVAVVANDNPSLVKTYNAVSIEGTHELGVISMTSSNGGVAQAAFFTEREGAYYSAITGDTSSNSTSHIIPLGEVSSVDVNSGVISFVNRVNTLPLMVGATVMEVDADGNLTNIGTPINNQNTSRTLSSVTGAREMQLNAGTSVSLDGSNLVLVLDQVQNGDRIRGHYVECSFSLTLGIPMELFAINLDYSASPQNHALGQQ